MDELNRRVTDILTKLEHSLSGRGAAWGNDSYGATFAEGDQGYNAAHANLKSGFTQLAGTFESYADGQRDAAALLDKTDHRGARGLGGA